MVKLYPWLVFSTFGDFRLIYRFIHISKIHSLFPLSCGTYQLNPFLFVPPSCTNIHFCFPTKYVGDQIQPRFPRPKRALCRSPWPCLNDGRSLTRCMIGIYSWLCFESLRQFWKIKNKKWWERSAVIEYSANECEQNTWFCLLVNCIIHSRHLQNISNLSIFYYPT